MIDRRGFLGITVGACATLALTPELLREATRKRMAELVDSWPLPGRRGGG